MGTTKALLTADQFGQLKTGELEDYELVDGELIPLASGTFLHAWIRDGLCLHFRLYFQDRRNGVAGSEVDCRLAYNLVRRPDVAVFLLESGGPVSLTKIPISRTPDIAVEVLSPSEGAIEVNRKVLEYLAAGSFEVWVVDQANDEVLVWTKDSLRVVRGSESLKSPLLPGFEVHLNELFKPPYTDAV